MMLAKHLLEYDDVANDQRKVVYELRDELMSTEDVKDRYDAIRHDVINDLFDDHISPKVPEEDWDSDGLQNILANSYGTDTKVKQSVDDGLDVGEILRSIQQEFVDSHNIKEQAIGAETMRTFEKAIMLKALDHHWKEHLAVMDQLRQSVNLRAIGQKNPVQEYKRESFSMFTDLLQTINIEMVKAVCSLSLETRITPIEESKVVSVNDKAVSPNQAKSNIGRASNTRPLKSLKVGRNDPCPCGSGKKYKQCHG